MTFKEIIQTPGRRFKKHIEYVYDNNLIELVDDSFVKAKLGFKADLTGTCIKSLELETKNSIPVGAEVYFSATAYLDQQNTATENYGPFYIKDEPEYQADKVTYIHKCYDKMMLTMVDYEALELTYPVKIQTYFDTLIQKLGFISSVALVNGNLQMQKDVYDDLGYTYRDVIDDIAKANGILIYCNGNELIEGVESSYEHVSSDNGLIVLDSSLEVETKYNYNNRLYFNGNFSMNGDATPTDFVPINTFKSPNLINLYSFYRSGAGVKFTTNNGAITAVGTATGSTMSITTSNAQPYTIELEAGTYYVSGATATCNIQILTSNNSILLVTSGSDKFTLNSKSKIYYRAYVTSGTTVNETIYPIISKEYIPYIEANKIMLNCVGKNVLSSELERGALNSTGDKSGATNRLRTKDLVRVEPNQKYILSATASEQLQTIIYEFDNYGKYVKHYSTSWNNIPFKFTPTNPYINIVIRYRANTTLLLEDVTNVQLEKGQEVTSYQQYNGKKLIDLKDYELMPEDYIYISHNRVMLHKEWHKMVLDGTENWGISGTGTNKYFYQIKITNNIPVAEKGYLYCTHYKQNLNSYISSSNTTQGISSVVGADKTYWYLRIRYGEEETLDNFKTFLANNKPKVYYKLQEPYEIDLGSVDFNLVEGQNTISILSSMNPQVMQLDYAVKTKTTINDDILMNTNIDFGQHYGPINTIVLSRSADSDNIYYPTTLPEEVHEYKISDNQLMNENNRVDFIQGIYNKLNGLEYDVYDTKLTGFGGFEPLERLEFITKDNTYNSFVYNWETTYTAGYEETIYTELPEETTTNYKAASTTDKMIKQTYIIADKQQGQIQQLVSDVETIDGKVSTNTASITTNAGAISAEVSRATGEESRISGLVELKVSKSDNDQVVSMLNASANVINLNSNRLTIDSDKFALNANGEITKCSAINITGGSINLVSSSQEDERLKITDSAISSCYWIQNARVINWYGTQGGRFTVWNFMAGPIIGLVSNDGTSTAITPYRIEQGSLEIWKKDFEEYNDGLKAILETDIYKYHYKAEEETSKKHIGILIGDTRRYSKDFTSDNEQGVDLYSMISACINAIQIQQKQIDTLQKQIEELKK